MARKVGQMVRRKKISKFTGLQLFCKMSKNRTKSLTTMSLTTITLVFQLELYAISQNLYRT